MYIEVITFSVIIDIGVAPLCGRMQTQFMSSQFHSFFIVQTYFFKRTFTSTMLLIHTGLQPCSFLACGMWMLPWIPTSWIKIGLKSSLIFHHWCRNSSNRVHWSVCRTHELTYWACDHLCTNSMRGLVVWWGSAVVHVVVAEPVERYDAVHDIISTTLM